MRIQMSKHVAEFVRYQLKLNYITSDTAMNLQHIWRALGQTAVLVTAIAAMGAFAIQPAEASLIEIFPGDVSSNENAITGVVGDGTLGNDAWHVTTGPKYADFFWLGDPLFINNGDGITIRDIVHVSFDVKHSGGYADPTFSMQMTTYSPKHPDGTQAIDFLIRVRDDTSVDDSASFNPGKWNTYEWNQAGDAATGLEGTMHQNESDPGTGNGGNGENNHWFTLKETLSLDAQYQSDLIAGNDDYYDWLDDPIDSLKITARDVGGDEFDGWVDNFTFTYDTGDGEQTVIADFAAVAVTVPEPATLGIGLFGIILIGMALITRRHLS